MFPKPDTKKRKAEAALRIAEAKREFRRLCFERDSYKCRCCGQADCGNSHHIIHGHREPIHDLSNRITLCLRCHDAVHGRYKIEIGGVLLSGWILMLAILDNLKGREGYRWEPVYEEVKINAEKQRARV